MSVDEGIAQMRKLALSFNIVLVLALVILLLMGKNGSYFIFVLMVALPLISILTFVQKLPERNLLGVCWMGNAVGSVLMGLTSITSLLMISRAAAFSLVLEICLIFTAVQIYSASVALKMWRIAGEKA